MIKISIIVPIYKVERYLQECVKSVLAQTYRDFEVILVDDGSPDECPKICDYLQKQDQRVRVIHQENGGLSSARNAGIEIAQGEYLFFLDSDDYIHPQTLEILLSIAQKDSCDIVCSNYQITRQRPRAFDRISLPVACEEFSGVLALEKMYDSTIGMSVVAWAKLYRRCLFQNIRYPVGCLHEDEFTTYKVYFRAHRVAYTDQELYYYYENPNSITHVAYKPQRLAILQALHERLSFLEENHLKTPFQLTQRLYVIQLMEHFYQVSQFLPKENHILAQLKKELKSQIKAVKSNPYFQKRHWIAWLSFCISPAVFHNIYCAKLATNDRRYSKKT